MKIAKEEREKPRLLARPLKHPGGREFTYRGVECEKKGGGKVPREERDAGWSAYKVDTKWSGLRCSAGIEAYASLLHPWSSPRLFTRCTFRLHRIHVQAGVQMRIYAMERVHARPCVHNVQGESCTVAFFLLWYNSFFYITQFIIRSATHFQEALKR